MTHSTLGQRVQKRRKSLDLTQEALARKCGISIKTVCSIEQGVSTNVQLATLEALADGLRVDVEDLTGKRPRAARKA